MDIGPWRQKLTFLSWPEISGFDGSVNYPAMQYRSSARSIHLRNIKLKKIRGHLELDPGAPGQEVRTQSIGLRLGSGGGASGRATAFCPSEPGLDPRADMAFFRNCYQSISLGV